MLYKRDGACMVYSIKESVCVLCERQGGLCEEDSIYQCVRKTVHACSVMTGVCFV